MAKKVTIMTGGPAYMASYTDMMMALLAFFILLNTLTHPKQAAGFKTGSGDIKNAAGIKGGIGINENLFYGKGGSYAPNKKEKEKKSGVKGFDKDLVDDVGGSGNTTEDVDKKERGKYFRIKIPFIFNDRETRLNEPLKNYLKKIGLAFALTDYKIKIKYFSDDIKNAENENKRLSMYRSLRIIKNLSDSGVSEENLSCGVYENDNYLAYVEKKFVKTPKVIVKRTKLSSWGAKQTRENEKIKSEWEEEDKILNEQHNLEKEKLEKEQEEIPKQIGYFYITL